MEALIAQAVSSLFNVYSSVINTVGKIFEVRTSQNIEDAAYYNNSAANINALAGISYANKQVEAAAIAQQRAATLYASLVVVAVIAAITLLTLKTKK